MYLPNFKCIFFELYERYVFNTRNLGSITALRDLFAKPLTALNTNVKMSLNTCCVEGTLFRVSGGPRRA